MDVALISVSPPDEHGFCSFGVEVGTTKPAAESARNIIAEINPHMPRTLGDTFIHVSRISQIVEVDYPLPEAPQGGTSDLHLKVGEHIAETDSGRCHLTDGHRQHPRRRAQAPAQPQRSRHPYGTLLGRCDRDGRERRHYLLAQELSSGQDRRRLPLGTQRLYDFVHNNPIIELHPTDYVNDPFNIAANDNMVAINSALQVDLTGQVCADSMAPASTAASAARSTSSAAQPAPRAACPSSPSRQRPSRTPSVASCLS